MSSDPATQPTALPHVQCPALPAQVPALFKLGPINTVTAGLAMLPRMGKGSAYRKAKMPKKSLEIWGYEASPFVKLAREVGSDLL